ncbi:unnamed protein product [Closterium sp. Yama58-4]|nr:unnamed protein product [Closterium sp. Yama58-4]
MAHTTICGRQSLAEAMDWRGILPGCAWVHRASRGVSRLHNKILGVTVPSAHRLTAGYSLPQVPRVPQVSPQQLPPMSNALPFRYRFRQFSTSAVNSAPGTLPPPASPTAPPSPSLSASPSPLPTHGEGMILERAAVSTAEFTAHFMDGGVEEVLESRYIHVAATATPAASASFWLGTGQQISARHVAGLREGQPSASFSAGGRGELRGTDVKDDGSTGGGEGRAEVREGGGEPGERGEALGEKSRAPVVETAPSLQSERSMAEHIGAIGSTEGLLGDLAHVAPMDRLDSARLAEPEPELEPAADTDKSVTASDTDKTASCPHAATGLVDAGGGKVVKAMGMRVRIKAEAEQTGGSYSVIEYEVPAGEGSEEHIHTREHEAWFLLDGQMTWTIEKETYQASQGSFMHMPLGRAHSFRNNSDRPARMLVVCMPGGLEKYFLEIGDPEEAAGKAPEQSPGGAVVHKPVVDQAKLQNAMKKAMLYGLVYPKDSTTGKAPEQSPGGAVVHRPVVEQAKVQDAIQKAIWPRAP